MSWAQYNGLELFQATRTKFYQAMAEVDTGRMEEFSQVAITHFSEEEESYLLVAYTLNLNSRHQELLDWVNPIIEEGTSEFLEALIRQRAFSCSASGLCSPESIQQDYSIILQGAYQEDLWTWESYTSFLFNQKQYEKALQAANTAYSIDSTSTLLLAYLSMIQGVLGMDSLSDATFQSALAGASIDELLIFYNNQGFNFLTQENYTAAIPFFDKAIALFTEEMNPLLQQPLALSFNNRGYCLLQSGDPESAIKDIDYSLVLFPSNSYAYRNRAKVHLYLKDTPAACLDLQKALEFGFSNMYGSEVQELKEIHCQ